jgi:hypothetical protein
LESRPKEGERKKFCMSIMMRAALAGSTVMGWVVVERVREGVIDGEVGVGGWVKSKPVEGEKSQKLEEEPITV